VGVGILYGSIEGGGMCGEGMGNEYIGCTILGLVNS